MSYASNAVPVAADRAITLNERLNKSCKALQYQCERLEMVLNRVHGTPSKLEGAVAGGTAPTPTLPMQAIVEHLEQVQGRLSEIAGGIERIA